MSGFVCVLHRDGAPVDRALLHSLTHFLSFRGPDAQAVWCDSWIGMGHALLRTADESENEQQPAVLEGRYWIVADARLDDRKGLLAKLRGAKREVPSNAPACELILHAYAAWGTACVDHFLGDFSFALWDSRNKQLFCARDHFGIKPFYYAQLGEHFLCSNTLNCLRSHPGVSNCFSDLAISDFLLFDMIREPAATSFADIRRLPPAHNLVCDAGQVSVRRYWTLPLSEPLFRSQSGNYIEQFQELLDRAVADRVRADNVGVLMSGGLDSTSVAASARRTLVSHGTQGGLRAYTDVFENLIPHEERLYATIVADALKIPIEFHVSDDVASLRDQNHPDKDWPEPVHSPLSDGGMSQLRQVATKNRVALTGFGGDPALSCLLSVHFSKLLKRGQIVRALTDAMRYLTTESRVSRLYLRRRWQKWFPSRDQTPCYPGWLNEDLEKRLNLRERWKAIAHVPAVNGTSRRSAYEAVIDPAWPSLFEGYDPGVTGVLLEVRHPFFDLRLANFLLALPALPWCSDKQLLREAGRDVLPDAVRLRRKSPLRADPLIALLQQKESAWVDSFVPVSELARYVVRERIPRVFGEKNAWAAWTHLRPLSLNFWLRSNVTAG